MSDLTLKEVLIFDACEKDRELKKQAFIEWLEQGLKTSDHIDEIEARETTQELLKIVLKKAKEML
jgi:ribosomal protein S16